MENLTTFLTHPLPLSIFFLVSLKVIAKSITTLMRGGGGGGRFVLTMRMSEMTLNIVSFSSLFANACSFYTVLTNNFVLQKLLLSWIHCFLMITDVPI